MHEKRPRLPLNLFGIGFGLAGLAGTWTAAASAGLAPRAVADGLWVIALVTWLTTLVRYLSRPGGRPAVRADLTHPLLGPFAALVPVTGLLLAGRLAALWTTGGRIAAGVLLVVCTVYAGWFLAHLLRGGLPVDSLHPGYLLPAVAASLIAAQCSATVGWRPVAIAAFGFGMLSWALAGAALLARLALRPALPPALLPTMAIFSAPPAVAGNAWFAISGGRLDTTAVLLLGTMVPLLLLQLFMIPAYVRLPFTLGFWALTFTTAASGTYGVRWLAGTHVPGWQAWSWLIIAAATGIIGAIAVASVRLVRSAHRSRGHDEVVPVRTAAAVK